MEDYLIDVENYAVLDSLVKAKAVFGRHINVVVSISGGSDSDIVLDICEKVRKPEQKVRYVWFNTGIEYQATKDHLDFLEKKYNITIERIPPVKPIPTCVREYGVPFLSKYVSDQIQRLQNHDFKWEDEPYEVLSEKYPKCKSAIKWWCNVYSNNGFENSSFSIDRFKYLKEFLIQNPPTFRISNNCCKFSKKLPAKQCMEESQADLNVIGVRKAEGGIRAAAYKNCFTASEDGADQYRPLFFMTDDDKKYYEDHFGVSHSDCYTKYGLKRTGCVGCPYGRDVLHELFSIQMYEPKLYKACMKIFGDSYEYTKKYRQFCAKKKYDAKQDTDQMTMDDLFYDFSFTN